MLHDTLILLPRTISKSTACLQSNFEVITASSYSGLISRLTRRSSFSPSSRNRKLRKSVPLSFFSSVIDSIHHLCHNCFHVIKLQLTFTMKRDQRYAIYH